MTKVTYAIPAVHCDHCQMTIEREVGELAGVAAVSVDVAAKQASVAFEPPATQEQIEALLAEIGYAVEKPIQL